MSADPSDAAAPSDTAADTAAGAGALPEALVAWIERHAGGTIVDARPHFAGASRAAWQVDVASAGTGATANHASVGSPRALFLLCDRGPRGGSARDAAVLRALAGSAVPVPEVVADAPDRGWLLLTRLAGRSDFPNVDVPDERSPTARDLMRIAAALHALDPATLCLDDWPRPTSPGEAVEPDLERTREAVARLAERADPFFAFALGWLEQAIPERWERPALVHSDLGPGNFLYAGGRVTGIVDWEVAHFGDPHEDLAALAVRDMATPIGDLRDRFAEYASFSGRAVDPARVDTYRVLVLVRNAAMIGLGLAQPPEGFDVVEMTMYQTLLLRAATLVLCDRVGAERPAARDVVPTAAPGPIGRDEAFVEALERDLAQSIAPAIAEEGARRHAASLARGLCALRHAERVGPGLDAAETLDLARLLERDDLGAVSLGALEAALREWVASRPGTTAGWRAGACYFARRWHRIAERRRPLMGDMMERLPQSLEGDMMERLPQSLEGE